MSTSDASSIILVEFLGFGGSDDPQNRRQELRGDNGSYQNPASPVQVIGAGQLTPGQREKLTTVEQQNLGRP